MTERESGIRARAPSAEPVSVEEELLRSQARLISVIDSVTDAIIATGPDGRILLFNAAAEQIFDCAVAEAIGEPVERFVPAGLLEAEGEPEPQDVAARPGGLRPIRARRAGGDEFPAEAAVARIEVAGEDLCTVILRDVTERWRAEESLRKLSRAVEQSADGVCITDRAGVVEYANPAFEAMDRGGADARRYLERAVTPIRDPDGNVTHYVAVTRDITRHVRTEEALRHLNESLEQQARNIAQSLHDEAGQLLTSAHIALAEAARDVSPALRERLQEVRGHLDRIEDQLRGIAHELRPRILDDLGLVPALRHLAAGAAKRRGFEVAVEADAADRLPPLVETALYRLVQEALTNASKHARAAHVCIRIEQEPGALRCSIVDDGIGCDAPAVLARPGEPGLGMRGIRDRIEGLGGALRISPAPGGGTQLLATLPMETRR